MEIQIDNDTRIGDAQNQFSEAYPFLKIEFFTKEHAEKELSAVADMIPQDELFSSINTFLKPGYIDISEYRTVAEVERDFQEKFDVPAQVSRKSGDIWLQTSKTDDRTLEKQNDMGKAMSQRPM